MKFKKTLTCVLAAAMLTSMAVPAFAADTVPSKPGSESVEGSTVVRNPIFEFEVPKTLEIAINPFQKGDDSGSQIFSVDQQIINKSDVALMVSITPKMKLQNGAKYVETAAAAAPTSPTDTSKKIYMEIATPLAASIIATETGDANKPTVGGTPATSQDDAVPGTVGIAPVVWTDTYEAAAGFKTDSGAKAVVKTTPANMTFALQKSVYIAKKQTDDGTTVFSGLATDAAATTVLAAEGDSPLSATVFRFVGSVNTYADWAKEDVTVSMIVDTRGMNDDGYKAATVDNDDWTANSVKGANLWLVADAPDNGPSLKAPGAVTLSTETTTVIELNMGSDDGLANGVSKITIKENSEELTSSDYSFSAGKLTLKTGKSSTAAKVNEKLAGKTIVVTFSKTGNPDYSKTLEISLT